MYTHRQCIVYLGTCVHSLVSVCVRKHPAVSTNVLIEWTGLVLELHELAQSNKSYLPMALGTSHCTGN